MATTAMRLRDTVTVVTGGAGNIGAAISRELAAQGASTWTVDTDEKGSAEVSQSIREAGGRASFITADVTVTEEADRSVRHVLQAEGRIDALVNGVGRSVGLSLEDVDEEAFRQNVESNLKSALFMTKAVCAGMRERGRGSVIFISSVNALLGGFGEVAYASAKAGLHSLVRSLTAEYSPDGLRFNALTVGSVPGNGVWEERERSDPGTLRRLARLYPLRRLGEPRDVAQAVLFLASDESSWITGSVIPVDGGISATGALSGGRWWEDLPAHSRRP
jgi:NAD(P)-dependent dehydrogenase (short-subunit alcohol dehydrogenase family)